MPSLEELLQTPLSELTERFVERAQPVPRGLLEALEADSRQGARSLARRIRARQEENRSEGQRLRHLLRYEVELWTQGLERVAGVDEAGGGRPARAAGGGGGPPPHNTPAQG